MESVIVSVAPLSRKQLIDMSKGPLKDFLTYQDGYDQMRKSGRLWDLLIQTAKASNVGDGHLTSACNAISVFLTSAISSPIEDVRTFAASSNVFTSAYETGFALSERGKSKPARGLLTKVLSMISTGEALNAQDLLIHRALKTILTGHPPQEVNICSFVLSTLLGKTLSIQKLCESIQIVSDQCLQDWIVFEHQLYFGHNEGTVSWRGPTATLTAAELSNLYSLLTTALLSLIYSQSPGASTHLIRAIFNTLRSANASGSFFDIIDQYIDNQPTWVTITERVLDHHPLAVEKLATYLLPTLYETDQPSFVRLFSQPMPQSKMCSAEMTDSALLLWVSTIGFLTKRGDVLEENQILEKMFPTPCPSWPPHPSEVSVTESLLQHHNPLIRIQAFKVLISSAKPREGPCEAMLSCIARSLVCLHDANDPYIRGSLISLSKVMINRLRAGLQNARKDTLTRDPLPRLNAYTVFLHDYLSFLHAELYLSVPYQRHVIALSIILFLFESSCELLDDVDAESDATTSSAKRSFAGLLVDLLFDPYDDVRDLASQALSKILRSFNFDGKVSNRLDYSTPQTKQSFPCTSADLLHCASNLSCRTNRADHADGFGRLCSLIHFQHPEILHVLLRSLENGLAKVGGSFLSPIEPIPLHGSLHGLNYCVRRRNIEKFHWAHDMAGMTPGRRLVELCKTVWTKCKQALCVDAPEREAEEAMEDPIIGPKDMLSYSWRALRDSSQLLLSLISTWFHSSPEDGGPELRDFQTVGNLCMDQMSRLRHRGAFSAVSQTFSAFCQRCTASREGEVRRLLDVWYSQAIHNIRLHDDKVTRRSAGLPAMISAILSAKDDQFFETFMRDFCAKATDPLIQRTKTGDALLPHVHYLNCLREVFINSGFRTLSTQWLSDGLRVGAQCLTSHIWAIRNCGLMLLRAVIDRMGNHHSDPYADSTLRLTDNVNDIAPNRASEICKLALRLILHNTSRLDAMAVCDSIPHMCHLTVQTPIAGNIGIVLNDFVSDPERLCVGLNLVGRLTISHEDARAIRQVIAPLLGHCVSLIREQTARTITSLSTHQSTPPETLIQLVDFRDVDISNFNLIHGRLVCVKLIVSRVFEAGLVNDSLMALELLRSSFMKGLHSVINRSNPDLIQSIIIEIMNSCLVEMVQRYGDDSLETGPIQAFLVQNYTRMNVQAAALGYKLLNEILGFLIDLQPTSLSECIDRLAIGPRLNDSVSGDLDALRSAFTGLEKVHQSRYRKKLSVLYVHIILADFPDDVASVAAINLADMLRSQPDKDLLPLESVGKLQEWMGPNIDELKKPAISFQAGGRPIWNAKLRLRAALLGFQDAGRCVKRSGGSDCSFCQFNRLLLWSIHEDNDFVSRLNGMIALDSLTPMLKSTCMSSPDLHIFSPLIALYDLTNDDDEEIRDLAASMASEILFVSRLIDGSDEKTSPCESEARVRYLRLAPPAAASGLLHIFVHWFKGTQCLYETALSRLGVHPYSPGQFKDRVRKIQDRNRSILFEVEKQNLYRDKIREQQRWATLLVQTGVPSVDLEGIDLSVLEKGVSEGLDSVVDLNLGAGGSLSPDEDLIILIVQLLWMAKVLLSWNTPEKGEDNLPRQAMVSISKRMVDLKRATEELNFYPAIIELLE